MDDRVAALEAEVVELRRQLAAARAPLSNPSSIAEARACIANVLATGLPGAY